MDQVTDAGLPAEEDAILAKLRKELFGQTEFIAGTIMVIADYSIEKTMLMLKRWTRMKIIEKINSHHGHLARYKFVGAK